MNIGFIGAGSIATALASQFLKAGHDVTLSNRRGAESLVETVRRLGPGAHAASRTEAAQAAWLVLAVPWQHLDSATADLPPRAGRIVLDTMNPVMQPGFRLAELGGLTSSELVSRRLPGDRIVKIANTLPPTLLSADPHTAGGRRVLFMSGDDGPAKGEVAHVFTAIGFAVVDLGSLAEGGRLQQFPGGPLPALNLVKLG